MLTKTNAIALRVEPFSRTSHVVNWLAASHGRIATVIKGGQRPRSHLVGQYDLFYRCEIVFYQRSRSGLHILKECAVLDDRPALRSSWRAAVCASYCCDLTARCCPVGVPQTALFDLLNEALGALNEQTARAAFLYWFELQLLGRLGWAPRLSRCSRCGQPMPFPPQAAPLSVRNGGVVCPACAETAILENLTVGIDVLALLQKWQLNQTPAAAARVVLTHRQRVAVEEILGQFLAYYVLDLPASRTIALALIQKAGPKSRVIH